MQILVNLWTDDSELVSTLLVQAPNTAATPRCIPCGQRKKPQTLKALRELFCSEWETALEYVKTNRPDEWQVADVEERLRRAGWSFRRVPTADVRY